MLTNEQALENIKQYETCFVVWATDRAAIVAVHPIASDSTVEDRAAPLFSMSTDYQGPTRGRFLSSASVTLQMLNDEVEEIERGNRIAGIYRSWNDLTVDELIDMIISAEFPEPVAVGTATGHLVERLYKSRGPSLTRSQIDRLDIFSRSESFHPDQKDGRETLRCYLCALNDDPARLKQIWQEQIDQDVGWARWREFSDAAGDLPTTDQEIIDRFIAVLAMPLMFGDRYHAMITLGKIGPNSGELAARLILETIYDSSEHVTAVRNRVVRRIRSQEADWTACPACFHGYADGEAYQLPCIRPCAECLGLGFLPRERSA